jgi:hypothetical protein
MKIEVIPNQRSDGFSFRLVLKYEGVEWQKLEQFYVARGLRKRQIRNLFGKWMPAEAYTLSSDEQGLLSVLDIEAVEREVAARAGVVSVRLLDDLNDRLLYFHGETLYVNLALFRIVPKENVVDLELPSDVISDFDLLGALAIALKYIVKTLSIYNSKFRVKYEIVVEPLLG